MAEITSKMEAGDYRSEGLFEGGIRKGAAVSLVIHVLAFMLAFAFYRVVPPRRTAPQVCRVNLITPLECGNRGREGAAGQGDPGAAPEPETAKRAKKTETVQEMPPVAPAPKAPPKPAEVRKPRPKAVPVSPRKQIPAKEMTSSSAVQEVQSEAAKAPQGPPPGQGSGSGGENAASGSGTGSGAGSGAGGGGADGPIASTFGSGDGPRFADRVLPRYPMLARELGREGIVLLQLIIDEKGRLVDVQLVKKAGSGFDEEALRAVRSSTFRPAIRNGRAVSCKAQLPVRFVMRNAAE